MTLNNYVKTLIAIAAVYSMGKFAHRQTHGFSYLNFTIKAPSDYTLKSSQLKNPSILEQNFSFFGYGGESLVFVSDDDKWVLKLFKKHRLYPYREFAFLKAIPVVNKILSKQELIYTRFWDSLKIQADKLQDVSFLEYIHMPSSREKPLNIRLKDPLGSYHSLDLSKVCFVIQKKGELFRDVYLSESNDYARQCMLEKLVHFYKKLDEKDMKIWDNSISRNMGWLNDEPFLIDTGSTSQKNPDESFQYTIKHLVGWVNKFDPDKTSFVNELIEKESKL